ncbi:GGDEF domain-containing phosphodiesterase [Halomonas sp. SIMBA_159]
MSLIENIDIITKYGNLALSADIGVACYSQGIHNSEELIDHADMAIFKAKTSPSAEIHFFDGSLKECQKERYFLERAIKQGLYNNQFIVFYQPIFTVCNGELMGMEALARWQHPDKGLLGPAEFIPLMEEKGLVSQLTEQVMAQALCQLSYWHPKHPSLFMSLNLSARDIQKPIFLNRLASLIELYQLPPSCIVLEITESLLLFDWPQANH